MKHGLNNRRRIMRNPVKVIERTDIGRNIDFASIPNDAEAKAALIAANGGKLIGVGGKKVPIGELYGKARSLPKGTIVDLRIDIPTFNRQKVYVVTVHKPKTKAGGPGDVIGYENIGRVTDPVFIVNKAVSSIYEGKSDKFPVATVHGKFDPRRTIPNDIEEWTPVGMDPKEHAFFYDKRNDRPVVGGKDAISVGNTVFVKVPVYGKREDYPNPRRNSAKRNPATENDLPPAQGARARSPQIDTPAFKRWFNGSVVATRNGKPRIMYHGTGWTNLSEFRSFRSRKQIAGFFAFNPEFAEDFAMKFGYEDHLDYEEGAERKYPSIYPVYLSLKKVFDVRKKEDRDAVSFDQLVDRDGLVEGSNGWTWTVLERPELVSRMKRSGFDGFLDFENGSELDPTGIAVFDPRNIKSAIGNRGTFDPADPDIRNPRRSMIRSKLSRIIEPGDRVLDYDRAQGEDLYRLWDLVHTDMALTPEALVEIEGMLDDDGVLVIQSGEEPAGLRDHFRRVVKYQGMLLVQSPMNPEEARINTEKLRRDLE